MEASAQTAPAVVRKPAATGPTPSMDAAEGGPSTLDIILIVVVGMLASSTVTIVIIKVTKCCGQPAAGKVHAKENASSLQAGDSDTHYNS